EDQPSGPHRHRRARARDPAQSPGHCDHGEERGRRGLEADGGLPPVSDDYTPWHRSISKLLGEEVFNYAMPPANAKRRLAEALNRIHGRLPAMAPYTPVC